MKFSILTFVFLLCFEAISLGQFRAPARPDPRPRLLSATSALNPGAPGAPESRVAITGMVFTDESRWNYDQKLYELGGVMAWIGDEPQVIRSVLPSVIEIIPSKLTSWIIVKAKDGRVGYAIARMSTSSPGMIITGEPESPEAQAKTPLGIYFTDLGVPMPVTLNPVPLPSETRGRVILLYGSGWRNAQVLSVTVGGISCPVLSYEPFGQFNGEDRLIFGLLPGFSLHGQQEVVLEADGQKSNIARINFQ